MPKFLRLALLPLLLVLLSSLPASPAAASRTQSMTFEAPRDLYSADTRDEALETISSLGVTGLRIVLYWNDVAPQKDASDKPDFDTTDPANYDWTKYEPVLDYAKAQGWEVLLTVSGPVPVWATKTREDHVTRPLPDEFAQFMTAVGRKFSDRVATWSIWNEPNQPDFLGPQFVNGRAYSPRLYRDLYKAGLKGLAAAQVTEPRVLLGETAPIGTSRVVAPLTFLRGALCLDSKYKRSKAKGCSGTLETAGYAHHAYTRAQGPGYVPPSPNAVTIGVLSRLTKALDRAAKAKTIPAKLPVFLTEFGIQSYPDKLSGVSLQRQAEYRSTSERIAYDNSRVASFSQYLLSDDPPGEGVDLYGGFESGLRTAAGKDKPSLAGFRLPLAVRRSGSTKIAVWGLVRPAHAVATVKLQYRDGTSGAWRAMSTLRTDSRGYFSLRGTYRKSRQYRVRWTAPDGTERIGPPTRVV